VKAGGDFAEIAKKSRRTRARPRAAATSAASPAGAWSRSSTTRCSHSSGPDLRAREELVRLSRHPAGLAAARSRSPPERREGAHPPPGHGPEGRGPGRPGDRGGGGHAREGPLPGRAARPTASPSRRASPWPAAR
jgi:hypothetical protein